MNINIKTAANAAIVIGACAGTVYVSKKLGEFLGRGTGRAICLGRAAYKTEQAFDEIIAGNKRDDSENWHANARAQLSMLWDQNVRPDIRKSKFYADVTKSLFERFERRLLLKVDINGINPSTDAPEQPE